MRKIETEDKLITFITIISMVSMILFTITLIVLFRVCQEQKDKIIAYENTIIESDYCNEEECYTGYQKFVDYVNNRD